MTSLQGIRLVTTPASTYLNVRQETDYERERKCCAKWLLTFGISPDKAEGYARSTVSNRMDRMDRFYRFIWEEEDGYTAGVTHDHAHAWMKHLAHRDVSNGHRNASQKAVMMLFKWRAHERDGEEWEPEIRFGTDSASTTPRDYLTRDERREVREAALELGSIPG
jgi:site-specific recombinase XerD